MLYESGFSREMKPIEFVYIPKEIYYKKSSVRAIMEVDKCQDLHQYAEDLETQESWWC